MTSPLASAPADPPAPAAVWRAVRMALAVPIVLGTLGYVAVGFGTMTACTNEYLCTATGCPPCATADNWLSVGWAGQGLLLLAAGLLALLAARRVRPREVRTAALWLVPTGIALLVVTTVLAQRSF